MRHTTRHHRRALLAAGAAALLARPRAARAARWKRIPIGVQAWCVRQQMKDDVPGTLAALARLGFEGIELENAFGLPGPTWRKHLDAVKLRACGFHHHLEDLRGDRLAETIAFNRAIGNRNLVVRSLPRETYGSRELLARAAAELGEIAGRLAAAGMRLAYHNHTDEFEMLGDATWFDRFADATRSHHVLLEVDTGNATERHEVDVVALLRRNAGRAYAMHVKPHSRSKPDAFVGDDELDWRAIMTAAERVGGIEWYIIEYERDSVAPLVALEGNLQRFRKLRA